jgi:hypothetical protein
MAEVANVRLIVKTGPSFAEGVAMMPSLTISEVESSHCPIRNYQLTNDTNCVLETSRMRRC